jgi:CBS domain-containing protein
MTVGEICTRSVVTASPTETIVEAARRMRDRHVGDLVVVTDGELRPLGMLTDRDIVVSAVAQSADRLSSLLVADVMSRDLVSALLNESVDDALKRM